MSARPKTPGLVYGAVALALLVLISLVALSARQPPPPGIAEFAPQAVEHIVDSPDDLRSGARAGSGTAASPSPDAPALSQAPIPVSRVRKCVGDPPRQIEDPQSPPCVPYWAGDNGGATSRGVTASEILVARPGGIEAIVRAFQTFFNSRFEFYGRKLRIVQHDFGGDGDPDPAREEANAQTVISEGAFASLSYPNKNAGEVVYYDALARGGVLSVHHRPMWRGESEYAAHSPYEWSYLPGGNDVGQRNFGRWICRQLAGRPAEFAGPGRSGRTRRFGVMTTSSKGFAPAADVVTSELRGCGQDIAERAELTDYGAQSAANATLKLANAGVNSVVCVCDAGGMIFLTTAAQSQGYDPEWLMTTFMYNDEDVGPRAHPPTQRVHEFGLRFRSKTLPIDDQPSTWAIVEVDPSQRPASGVIANNLASYDYPELLLLASGIQMAGPNLTPETFKAGLQRTIFPNPGAGTAPYYQGKVGFAGRHTMMDGAAVIWWGENEPSIYSDGSPGTFCTVARGERFSEGGWPAYTERELRPFTGSCR